MSERIPNVVRWEYSDDVSSSVHRHALVALFVYTLVERCSLQAETFVNSFAFNIGRTKKLGKELCNLTVVLVA